MEQQSRNLQQPADATPSDPMMGVVTELNGAVTDPAVFNYQAKQVQNDQKKKSQNKARKQMIAAMVVSIVIAVGCGIASVIIALSART